MNEEQNNEKKQEVHSTVVRAGKRTYFFDIKTTRKDDLYLTLTESKKVFNDDRPPSFQKHKIFLYKEDFEKFVEALESSIEKINELKLEAPYSENGSDDSNDSDVSDYSSVDFEDLS